MELLRFRDDEDTQNFVLLRVSQTHTSRKNLIGKV